MATNPLVNEYLGLMTSILDKLIRRIPDGYKAGLAEQNEWLQTWSLRRDGDSDFRHLTARHLTILRIIRMAKESTSLSETNEILEGIDSDLQRADVLISDFSSPRIVQKRMRKISQEGPGLCHPIFLVSSWRSGTTLLMTLLGSHKDLVALPEISLLDPFLMTIAEITRNRRPLLFQRRPTIVDACNSTVRLGVSEEQFFEYFSVFIDSLMSQYVRDKRGRRWIYKEIINADSLDLIDILFGYRARFIWLIRHALDVINSEIERYERRSVQYADMREYAREWVTQNEAFADFHDRTPERCLKVRYEDLTAASGLEVRRILNFLSESWDDEMFNRMRSSTDALGGDHKFVGSAGIIDPSRTHRWTEWPQAYIDQLGSIVNPMLRRAGYEAIVSIGSSG